MSDRPKPGPASPFRRSGGSVQVRLRVTPKARANGVSGIGLDAGGNGFLKVSVTAPPDKGKANAAVIKLLAKEWGLAKSDVRVVSGETSRDKKLEISDPDGLRLPVILKWAGDIAQ